MTSKPASNPTARMPLGLPPVLEEFLAEDPAALLLADGAPPSEPAAGPPRRPRVGAWLADLAALRERQESGGSGSAGDVRSPLVGVLVAAAAGVLTLVPRPEWPPLLEQTAVRAGAGSFTVLRFARPVPVAAVLAELGRQAVWHDASGDRGLLVADLDPAPPAELERAPVRVADQPGPLALGPIDQRLVNPVGFLAETTEPVAELTDLDTRAGVGPALIASLRRTAGVRVGLWDEAGRGVVASTPTITTVAGLALAGVPITTPAVPPDVRRLVGDAVANALSAPVDLADRQAREEHSLVLRRAAFDVWADPCWRAAVAARLGVPLAAHPPVSIVLATRRPEQLDFALGQVARQRGLSAVELVLAPHGFEVDAGRVREALTEHGGDLPVQVVAQPVTTVFGDVLHAATHAAGGDLLLKVDDDDWYAPDFVADLLRARSYSGAELVGMPADRQYLAGPDVTVRRGIASEVYARFVAGGTMLVSRAALAEAGGFRSVRKYVDAQLLQALAACGAETYRTHGLGYLLRRNPTGHTWEVDHHYLLDPARTAATEEGFRPGRLMELTEH